MGRERKQKSNSPKNKSDTHTYNSGTKKSNVDIIFHC